MAETIYVLAAVTLVLALAGGFLPIFSKWESNPERLKISTGIAAGILLASAMMVVIPEGFELATTEPVTGSHEHEGDHGDEGDHGGEYGPLVLGGAILAGFLVMLILEGSGIGHAVHEEHHDHSHDHGHGHVHHQTPSWMLVLGLSLHSAADGLAIGAAAAGGVVAVTALVTFAVIVHKVPAAFSLGVFSLHERSEKKDAMRDVVLFSLATPVMIILSFHAFAGVEVQVIGLAMLFASGTFLYVATVDTLPDIHNTETGKKALKHVLIGAMILAVIFFAADASGMIEHVH